MGRIILSSDDNYQTYMDGIRNLVDPSADEEMIPNTLIDSIVYLHAVEDELLDELSDAADPNHAKRNDILRYVMFGTAIGLLYKFPQILRSQEIQTTTVIQEVDFKEQLAFLREKQGDVGKKIGVTPKLEYEFSIQLTTDHSSKAVDDLYRGGSRYDDRRYEDRRA